MDRCCYRTDAHVPGVAYHLRHVVSQVTMWPFFCFYGGKWRAAPHYPRPAFTAVVEPFAGAAGYATRYAHLAVTLVEVDPIIASLWRYLVDASSDDIRRIPLLQTGQTVDELACCADARALVGFWINKGSAAPKKSQSAWMRAGVRPKSFWGPEIRERIAQQVTRIGHWRIIEGDYTSAPDIEATWFVDPPYEGSVGRRYRFSDVNYDELGLWTRRRSGQIVACENEGATWLPFSPFRKTKANESKHGHKVSAEAVWSRSA